jgi:hypothetical protein
MPNPADKLPEGTPVGTDDSGHPIYEINSTKVEDLRGELKRHLENASYIAGHLSNLLPKDSETRHQVELQTRRKVAEVLEALGCDGLGGCVLCKS